MPFLASIGMWLLKTLLGGIFGKIESSAKEEAVRQKDAALLKATTVEEGKTLEVKMIKDEALVEKKFEEDKAKRPPDDPFGAKAWNSEGKQ